MARGPNLMQLLIASSLGIATIGDELENPFGSGKLKMV